MFSLTGKFRKALILSVSFHLVILGILVLDLTFSDAPKKIKAGELVKTIKAEVIDQKQLDELQKKKDDNQARIKKEQEKKKKALAAKKRAEKKKKQDAEKKRRADKAHKDEQKRKKLAADKKKQQAAKLKAAQKKKADEKRKADKARKAEEKHKAEQTAKVETQRKADEKRKLEEARLAEEKRKQDEARRKQQELERQQAEKRRLAEEEQKRKEADLTARLQAEETRRKLDKLEDAYILAISQKVRRNWIRPAGSENIPECWVQVVQGPGGIILDVNFGDCNGSNATYRASIENAIYKAEPLPKPGDPSLFQRELKFNFSPNN